VANPKEHIFVVDETDNEQEITEYSNIISPDCDEVHLILATDFMIVVV